jgi:hypothetical protein
VNKRSGKDDEKMKKAKKKVVKKKVSKKKATNKAASPKGPVRKKRVARVAPQQATTPHPEVSPRERYEMIATMAYYRAENRNFEAGHEMDDWIECEHIVDQMLAPK